MSSLMPVLHHTASTSSRMMTDDDCPETYRAWRSSFLNTIRDLDLTGSEKLDLLLKWLGKESSEHLAFEGSPHRQTRSCSQKGLGQA